MNIEQRLAEAIRSFSLDALAGAVPLNVDLDVVLSVLAHTVCAALRRRLPGYHTATPDTVTVRLSPPHLFTRCSAKPTYHRALAGQPHPPLRVPILRAGRCAPAGPGKKCSKKGGTASDHRGRGDRQACSCCCERRRADGVPQVAGRVVDASP